MFLEKVRSKRGSGTLLRVPTRLAYADEICFRRSTVRSLAMQQVES
jgi:hypothetical protein